jgi:hypothetical protein
VNTHETTDAQRAEELQRLGRAHRTDWERFEPIWPARKLVRTLPYTPRPSREYDPYNP